MPERRAESRRSHTAQSFPPPPRGLHILRARRARFRGNRTGPILGPGSNVGAGFATEPSEKTTARRESAQVFKIGPQLGSFLSAKMRAMANLGTTQSS